MSVYEQFATGARDFACGIYQALPGALVPDVLADARRFIWDEICGTNPSPSAPALPPPPAPPFTGGQCVCIAYRVTYVATGGGLGNTQTPRTVDVLGDISSVQLVTVTVGQLYRVIVTCRGAAGGTCLPPGQQIIALQFGGSANFPAPTIVSVSVARIGGQPDNCGNPPSSFPPATAPPGGFTSPPVTITNNDGTTRNYNFNFSPVVAPPLPTKFIPPVIVNIIRPEISPTFNIPVEFNFDGSINFGDGGGDDSGDFNQDDRDTINNINNSTTELGDQITNIQNEINNVTNINNNKPPDPNDFEPPITDQPPGEYEQTFLGAVQVILTEVPLNAKTQSGNTAADILYAGWFEWKVAGFNLPRQPIHFRDNIFLAPKGVDGFGYTLYTGFNGKATSIIYKEKI